MKLEGNRHIVGRLQSVVEVIEEKSEADTKSQRQKKSDEGLAESSLRQRRVGMRSRRSDGDAIRPAIGRNLHLLLVLEECVVKLLVCFQLLVQATQHDFGLALLIGRTAFLRIDLL